MSTDQRRSTQFKFWQLSVFICLNLCSSVFFCWSWMPVAAQQKKSADSILGVKIGDTIDQARAKLNPLGTNDGRATREGGRKEAWTMKETDFVSVALKTNSAGRIVWITGFLRPGREIPFAKLGDLSQAQVASDSQAIWNVAHPNGGYRLVVKGPNGKGRVLYMLSLVDEPPE